MTKKVYVGNLSFETTEEQVTDMFAEFGKVQSVAMINDRDSGRFRGFCFVEMEDSAANAAINALNGKSVDGRELRVNEARPREERSGGGGNRSGGGSRNRSGGGKSSSYGGSRSSGSGSGKSSGYGGSRSNYTDDDRW